MFATFLNLNFKKIINHNKKFFIDKNKKNIDQNLVLIEFNNFTANHIGLSYLSNILKKKYNAKLIAYFGHVLLTYNLERNFLTKFKILIGSLFGLNFFGVYKSFGVSKFFYPKISKDISLEKDKYFIFFRKKVKSLRSLERFKLNGVQIGDLLYDTYLKRNYDLIPTISLKDKKFLDFAESFITLFLIWQKFFKENKIKSIIASHSVYSLAIPLRIALSKKKDAYVLSPQYLRKLKKNLIYQSCETRYFKKIFKKINQKNAMKILNTSKNKIKSRLRGHYSSDYPYVTKSPFGNIKKTKLLNGHKKTKILIATHDFFDGPHANGLHLFPDYYHWFKFLCNTSVKTDYQWYVKTHPLYGAEWKRYVEYERKVVKNIIKDYKNITLLPANSTHNQIIKEGIDAVFTVHGTIALEYALFNVLTVNASLNNPHINYDFTLHPKNRIELEKIIYKIKTFKKRTKINKREIYEFYSIKNIFFSKNWLLEDYDKVVRDLGYHGLEGGKLEFYNYWVENFNELKHKKLIDNIGQFVKSKNLYLLNNGNLGNF